MSETKVPISERALIARINRKLKPDSERLKKLRGDRGLMDLGRYYIIDLKNGLLTQANVDLEETARSMGVLQPWERLDEENE